MEEVIKKIKEIKSGQVGIVAYSAESQNIVALYNDDILVPLARLPQRLQLDLL